MRKLTFLIGATAGYVLGARAGRDRYDQIAALAKRANENPKVAAVRDKAGDVGGELLHEASHKASELGGKAAEMGGKVAEKAPSWVPGSRTEGTDGLQSTPGTKAATMQQAPSGTANGTHAR
ncbi:MAG: hypothetical protein ACT4P1_04430 [Sporichthyaceae bacterium]